MDKDVEVRAKTFSTLGFYLFLPRQNSLANQDSLFSSRPKRARQQHLVLIYGLRDEDFIFL